MARLADKIYIYDTTLRDGGQTSFVDFTWQNKIDFTKKLDELGVDFIEAGWPGANPTDTDTFKNLPKLKNSKITAFGMTHRANLEPKEDKGFNNLLISQAEIITIVGKSWDFQVTDALQISLEDNLRIVQSSVKTIIEAGKQCFFDAEHFFDGFKENPEYSMNVIETAFEAGARWIVLCDTNGGTLPSEIKQIVEEVVRIIPGENLAIHCHNDTGNAVANSLAAVEAGARQIQGTINGLGERCGNADLTSLIPTLKLKLGYDVGVTDQALTHLKTISNYLCDLLNYPYDTYAPYVGNSAFAHKGGLHASAIIKNPKLYEHIDPHLVGNNRNILVSDQSGRASIIARLKEMNIDFDEKNQEKIDALVKLIKLKESQGYSYDMADASFALIGYANFHEMPKFFELDHYKVISEKRVNAKGVWVTVAEAVVKINICDQDRIEVAEGNGPVNALDKAFRKLLINYYPILDDCRLTDYKVRILNSESATSAVIRVLIETVNNKGERWVSVGVATDLIDASFMALNDAVNYLLLFKNKKHN